MNVRQVEIIDCLPNTLHPNCGDAIPAALIGCTIKRIGSVSDQNGFEGGLVIDYKPVGAATRRIILDFNESGMWVHSDTAL